MVSRDLLTFSNPSHFTRKKQCGSYSSSNIERLYGPIWFRLKALESVFSHKAHSIGQSLTVTPGGRQKSPEFYRDPRSRGSIPVPSRIPETIDPGSIPFHCRSLGQKIKEIKRAAKCLSFELISKRQELPLFLTSFEFTSAEIRMFQPSTLVNCNSSI